jgi:hypothetical protein
LKPNSFLPLGTILVMIGNADRGGGERTRRINQHNDKDYNLMMASAAIRAAALISDAKVTAMGLTGQVDSGV